MCVCGTKHQVVLIHSPKCVNKCREIEFKWILRTYVHTHMYMVEQKLSACREWTSEKLLKQKRIWRYTYYTHSLTHTHTSPRDKFHKQIFPHLHNTFARSRSCCLSLVTKHVTWSCCFFCILLLLNWHIWERATENKDRWGNEYTKWFNVKDRETG